MEKEKKERVILHSDMNNFFASVETIYDPSLKDKAIAVCGSAADRHGIVLAKSEAAKKCGVKTGMIIRDAFKLCPQLITVDAHHDRYEEYSRRVSKIYSRFTDMIEPFGIDEAWLDVTASKIFGNGKEIADKIRATVKSELGLTASVGVSFNKVFAKLGSDMKKPDGTTVISRDDYKNTIWRLPVENLLYVGKSTKERLNKSNVFTIGDLALSDRDFLVKRLGKWGETLYVYANGMDQSPVRRADEIEEIKSVGNSTTCYRDMETPADVKVVLSYLCESVSERVIAYGVGKACVISISVRDENLEWFTRQTRLPYPSVLSEDYLKAAFGLFNANYEWKKFVRSIGISVGDFISEGEQLTMGHNIETYEKKVKLAETVGEVRKKYGRASLQRGLLFTDRKILREEPITSGLGHPPAAENDDKNKTTKTHSAEKRLQK